MVSAPSIYLQAGKYTHVGYHYRKNILNSSDNVLGAPTQSTFYDMLIEHVDIFNVKDDFNTIARMQFRLDSS